MQKDNEWKEKVQDIEKDYQKQIDAMKKDLE